MAKMMALCLAPFMHMIVLWSQSGFIKSWNIHDNFLYVHNLGRKLHMLKKSTLLFKLDTKKTFDFVWWDHLLNLIHRRGFLVKLRYMLAALL